MKELYLWRVLICLWGLLGAREALAICTSNAPLVKINFPSQVTIQRDLAVGSIIAQAKASHTVTCRTPPQAGAMLIYASSDNVSKGGPVAGLSNVVPTGLPGIGIRWFNSTPNGRGVMTHSALNHTGIQRGIRHPIYNEDVESYSSPFIEEFELVKTGSLTPGAHTLDLLSIKMRQRGQVELPPPSLSQPVAYTITFPNTINLINASCSLVNQTIDVKMEPVSTRQFNGVNSRTTGKQFPVGLDCAAGTKINLTLDKTRQVPGFPGTIGLSGDSVAKGVGILISNARSGAPMPLGEKVFLEQAAGGRTSIELLASYIQTEQKVSAGSANGSLTFTLTYL